VGGKDALDGETLYLHHGSPSKLEKMAVDGSSSTPLTTGSTADEFRAFAGNRIVYSAVDANGSKLYGVSKNGGAPVALRPGGTGDDSFNEVTAGGVVVMTIAGPSGDPDLLGATADGSKLINLAVTTDPEQFRGSTPDGRVIYTQKKGTFLDDIYVVN